MHPGTELADERFQVVDFGYPSTSESPEQLVDRLRELVDACRAESPRVHFVGDSLGGILVRAYLAESPPPNVGRLATRAPPNRGSEIADESGGWAVFRWAMGPTARRSRSGRSREPSR